jgi:hypothetical protein
MSNTGYSATGANIINQNTKTPIAYVMNNIANDHASHFDKKLLSIQSDMPDYQMIEIADTDPLVIRKATTIGNFKADIMSGLIVNKVNSLQGIINIFPFVSQLLQTAQQTGIPVNVDVNALLREVAELSDVPNKNEVLPKTMPVQIAPPPAQPQPAMAA